MHYLVDDGDNANSPDGEEVSSMGQNPKVEEFHKRIEEIAPDLYNLLDKDGWGKTGFCDVWHNMYNHTVYSMCFGAHIPLDISGRILDWILLMDNEDHSLIVMLVYILKVQETKIINLTNGMERFQYIS